MICHACRRLVARGAGVCGHCGAVVGGGRAGALELVLPDGARVPLAGVVTIGREAGSSVALGDPSVSRRHARIIAGGGPPILEDVGSRFGTLLDGRRLEGGAPLRAGAVIRVGESDLRVDRARGEDEAGGTVVVPVGAQGAPAPRAPATQVGFRPEIRAGWALKRLPASEGERRFVLRNLRTGALVRMGAAEAELFGLIDGRRTMPELAAEADARFGPEGVPRLAMLMADLGRRGLLVGSGDDDAAGAEAAPGSRRRRLLRPREWTLPGAGRAFERVYVAGGWLLFTTPGLALVGVVVVLGLAAFGTLVFGRYGTPFVVADKVGLGGLAFVAGRLAIVAFHETAHGLVVASFGRRVGRAGVKLVALLPFAFVDTSEGWFEPRPRRLAISAAGPVSDAFVGGLVSLVSLRLPAGNLRDVLFQVALAAYIGAFFNLNPFLDRDGYHMLVDWLGQPGLRAKARARLADRLAGRPLPAGVSRSVSLYGALSLVWMLVAVGFVVVLSRLYVDRLAAVVHSRALVWAAFAGLYMVLLLPVAVTIGRPLVERRRARAAAEAERVVT